jgi:RNA polymerase sigma-70 factor (ECF subfamily)
MFENEYELAQQCVRENARAQRLLFERYAPRMFTVCLRYARHRMEAEDMLQDAFVRVFDKLTMYKGEGSLEGWIRRITVNVALKAIKKCSFQREEIGLPVFHDEAEAATALDKLSEAELMTYISELPMGYRTVFNMYVFDGFNHQEIAAELGIQEGTSRSQLVKARTALQHKVENERGYVRGS